jgi:integrase
VKNFSKTVGIEKVAPHDLRRTCARLCHVAGGELEQIQFLLGAPSMTALASSRNDRHEARNSRCADKNEAAGAADASRG